MWTTSLTVPALCLVNLAMGDAIITAWDSKNAYVSWRPLTAIRLGESYTNPDTEGNPIWQPLINTPNYPDHSSGANNVSAAATRSLALFFDTTEMTFTVKTTNPSAMQQTRTYSRFTDAAQEVVDARIYEGIHFGLPTRMRESKAGTSPSGSSGTS